MEGGRGYGKRQSGLEEKDHCPNFPQGVKGLIMMMIIFVNLQCKLTWAVKSIACPCFINWPYAVFSVVLWCRVITYPSPGLNSSPTGRTTRGEHTPVVEATVN